MLQIVPRESRFAFREIKPRVLRSLDPRRKDYGRRNFSVGVHAGACTCTNYIREVE